MNDGLNPISRAAKEQREAEQKYRDEEQRRKEAYVGHLTESSRRAHDRYFDWIGRALGLSSTILGIVGITILERGLLYQKILSLAAILCFAFLIIYGLWRAKSKIEFSRNLSIAYLKEQAGRTLNRGNLKVIAEEARRAKSDKSDGTFGTICVLFTIGIVLILGAVIPFSEMFGSLCRLIK